MRAYQRIKQRGEPAVVSAEAQAHLDARQDVADSALVIITFFQRV
jgi:hypothetical protein